MNILVDIQYRSRIFSKMNDVEKAMVIKKLKGISELEKSQSESYDECEFEKCEFRKKNGNICGKQTTRGNSVCEDHQSEYRLVSTFRLMLEYGYTLEYLIDVVEGKREPLDVDVTKFGFTPFDNIVKVNEWEALECPVCYTENSLISLGCDHKICEFCLSQIQSTCPLCRKKIIQDMTFRVVYTPS